MKKVVIGILAHVDAGKTTLTEAMLYTSGAIRKLGRVDHKDSFLDNYEQERKRGITIFSKIAKIEHNDVEFTIVDTPGHVDFAAEMERTLQVLDYAILVVNGREGIQGHTYTLAKLLNMYNIPTFVFVNKMDIEGSDEEKLIVELKKYIGDSCVNFSKQVDEELAFCHEILLEQYLETGKIKEEDIVKCIKTRDVIPCYFGSALKLINVDSFLDGLTLYTRPSSYGEEFAARVYKISRDKDNTRLTYMKITGGSLRVKENINTGEGTEKINQIRRYSGVKYQLCDQVFAGEIVAVTGLENTYPGQCLGAESNDITPTLEPVLTYKVLFDKDVNLFDCYSKLMLIDEEEPELNVIWDEDLKEIKIQLMGQVQLEVVSQLAKERFDMDISFDQGEILYKETIRGSAVGIGHFEPLRHYAECHLLVSEGERGSGVVIDSECSEDKLDRNWQRLIFTHLLEKVHTGPLTNSPITDIKINLIGGRAHLKHTEGGDFRQATYRALRNGLLKSENILLEPWYDFVLKVPQNCTGRAMSDITLMSGTFDSPEILNDEAVIRGRAPVSEMINYGSTVASYTGGLGILTFSNGGYDVCHNSEEVIAKIGYDAMSDTLNSGDSIFCKNGVGFNVPWNKVEQYAHVEIKGKEKENVIDISSREKNNMISSDAELDSIFEKTYGKPKDRTYIHQQVIKPRSEKVEIVKQEIKDEYLLVDGYNIIYSWEELKALSKVSFDGAREALIEILNNYQGFTGTKVIVVFDAYKVKGNKGNCEKIGNIDVVYTKEAETADSYIERFTYEKAKDYYVRVATSDNLEQLIILGHGAFKVSAENFRIEVKQTQDKIGEIIEKYNKKSALNSKVTIGDKIGNIDKK